MAAGQARELAIQTARRDPDTAVRMARHIDQPWYRAQALAGIAWHAPEADVVRIAADAARAALESEDAYQRVGGLAWSVRALAERGFSQRAREWAARGVALAPEIGHPVCRMDALFLLLQAAWPLGPKARRPVLGALLAACRAALSWKSGRTLRDVALMLAAEEPDEAKRILALIPEGRYRRQTARLLQEHPAGTPFWVPRSFFW